MVLRKVIAEMCRVRVCLTTHIAVTPVDLGRRHADADGWPAAEQLRVNGLAGTVTALLGSGRDSSEVERELFGVLEGLALLRMREHAIEVMRAYAPANAGA